MALTSVRRDIDPEFFKRSTGSRPFEASPSFSRSNSESFLSNGRYVRLSIF